MTLDEIRLNLFRGWVIRIERESGSGTLVFPPRYSIGYMPAPVPVEDPFKVVALYELSVFTVEDERHRLGLRTLGFGDWATADYYGGGRNDV